MRSVIHSIIGRQLSTDPGCRVVGRLNIAGHIHLNSNSCLAYITIRKSFQQLCTIIQLSAMLHDTTAKPQKIVKLKMEGKCERRNGSSTLNWHNQILVSRATRNAKVRLRKDRRQNVPIRRHSSTRYQLITLFFGDRSFILHFWLFSATFENMRLKL